MQKPYSKSMTRYLITLYPTSMTHISQMKPESQMWSHTAAGVLVFRLWSPAPSLRCRHLRVGHRVSTGVHGAFTYLLHVQTGMIFYFSYFPSLKYTYSYILYLCTDILPNIKYKNIKYQNWYFTKYQCIAMQADKEFMDISIFQIVPNTISQSCWTCP